jgi:argininosuccinate lyase
LNESTGRLTRGVSPVAREILFERHLRPPPDPGEAELAAMTQVDRAHLVMLVERGIVDPGDGARLLGLIEELRADGFAALRDRPAPRGRYLSYESYLIERLGPQTGGVLHSGRSRNDLNATTVRLRLRDPYVRLMEQCDALALCVLDRAQRYAATTMPAFTHHQPAVPITYGHYLSGVGAALARDMRDLALAAEGLDHNPLGAGACGGTSLPIDTRRTTRLLGFAEPLPNSLDAVASRDFVLRLLSACCVLGVLLSRVSHDLQAWSAADGRLIHMGDDVVGSSSMMPQKRNPFLLEHVQGKAAAPLGALTAAVAAMSTARFTNAIAVGTEAGSHVWGALEAITDAVVLLRLVVEHATPDPERMLACAADGLTVTTHLAERLVTVGVPFRTAHHEVGALAWEAVETGEPLEVVAKRRDPGYGPELLGGLDPASVAEACEFGGGPGPGAVAAAVRHVRSRLTEVRTSTGRRRTRWTTAGTRLDEAVRRLVAAPADGRAPATRRTS